jgi:hypothetical protein
VTRAADTTPPTTTATPAGGTYGASRNITLACVDDLSGCNHTYYTTNGDTPTTGSSIYSTTPITIATNTTLKFFSTDLANNPETPKTETYVIDATYPVTDITSHPNSTTNATSATFVFSANKESTFQCKLDTGSYTSCTSPQTYISLGEGSHTFTVQATDTLSHTEPSPSSYTWNIDLTPPVLSDGSPSGTLAVNTTSTTLQLTTNETATCAYSTTTGTDYVSMTPFTATNATTHTSTISSLQNGTSYTYYVKCQDSYGNTNSDDYSINFAIAAAPSATTYYLAPLTGNDANSGTTSPWATMEHLMTASSVVVPATVVTSTNQVTFVQNVQINPTASVTITIPDNTVMSTTTNSDFTQMTATTTVSTSALPTNYTSLGTVEYGFTSTPIALSQPVTISFAVDSSYNGQTLSVYRSEDAGTTWTQITTCTVTGGICSFTTSSLSSFAVASYTAPTTVVTTTSHSSGGGYLNRIIVGCDNRTTGFSITTGQSCVGNIGTTITTTTSTISTPSTSSGQANSAQNNFGTITLKFGSKGDAVKELQKFLNKTLKLKLKVDGSFGKSTVSAVKQWQKKNGFTADGVVGEKTRGKMEM